MEEIRIPYRGHGMSDTEYGEMLWEADLKAGVRYVATVEKVIIDSDDYDEEDLPIEDPDNPMLDIVFRPVKD